MGRWGSQNAPRALGGYVSADGRLRIRVAVPAGLAKLWAPAEEGLPPAGVGIFGGQGGDLLAQSQEEGSGGIVGGLPRQGLGQFGQPRWRRFGCVNERNPDSRSFGTSQSQFAAVRTPSQSRSMAATAGNPPGDSQSGHSVPNLAVIASG